MVMEDVKRQFVEQVKLRGYDDQYIDVKEEREILQIALQAGVTVEAARGALAQVCDSQNYVLESKVLDTVRDTIATFAENDGKVDEKEFADAVTICKKQTKDKKTDVECKRMVLQIMEDRSYKAKTGWFSNWYSNAKKEVGMV